MKLALYLIQMFGIILVHLGVNKRAVLSPRRPDVHVRASLQRRLKTAKNRL